MDIMFPNVHMRVKVAESIMGRFIGRKGLGIARMQRKK